jgi:hypothetical protein
VGISTIVPLPAADLIVTDDRLPLEARKVLEDHGSTVRIAAVRDN